MMTVIFYSILGAAGRHVHHITRCARKLRRVGVADARVSPADQLQPGFGSSYAFAPLVTIGCAMFILAGAIQSDVPKVHKAA